MASENSASPSTEFPRIDYTARDFLLLKIALEDFIKARFPDTFTDFVESNMGVMLLELCAWVGDMLSLNLDMQANECYLQTARQRDNVVNIVKLIGYEPRPPAAASVELLLDSGSPTGLAYDAIIAAGTSISIGEFVFELLEEYTLPAGTPKAGPTSSPYVEGPVFAEGTTFTDEFTGNNEAFQSYKLSNSPVIRNSVQVFVNGIEWEEVSALVYAGDNNSFSLEFSGEEESTIRFGNGVSGRKPQLGDFIEVKYRVGGGQAGNVAAGVVNTSVPAEVQSPPPATTSLGVTNPNPATGGEDQETIDSIKFNAPRFIRTHGNAITKEDYDSLSSMFTDPTYGSVSKAVAFPRYGKTNSSANEVDVWVWARDNAGALTAPSLGLKKALLDYLNARKVIVVDVYINDGVIVPIDVHVDLYLSLGIKDASEVTSVVGSAIRDWFNRDSLQPSKAFYVSELYREIMAVTGVLQCNIGIPGSPLSESYYVEVDQVTVMGVTTDVRVKAPTAPPAPPPNSMPAYPPGLDATKYASGSIVIQTGNLASRRYLILNNYKVPNGTPPPAEFDYLRVDGDLGGLAVGDLAIINSPLNPLRDIPLADNEIYILGNLTLNSYVRVEDTRETVIVETLI